MKPVAIIMIEDDHGHARLIEKNIRRAGINNVIHHYATGAEGLAHLREKAANAETPLLVMLDLNLPDMNGIDILAQIKQHESLKRTPVVVLTTTDDAKEIQKCYDLGCNVYMTKPVDYEQFASSIRQLGLFLSVIQVP
jgi:CheY-like chemotaxis protein